MPRIHSLLLRLGKEKEQEGAGGKKEEKNGRNVGERVGVLEGIFPNGEGRGKAGQGSA